MVNDVDDKKEREFHFFFIIIVQCTVATCWEYGILTILVDRLVKENECTISACARTIEVIGSQETKQTYCLKEINKWDALI